MACPGDSARANVKDRDIIGGIELGDASTLLELAEHADVLLAF